MKLSTVAMGLSVVPMVQDSSEVPGPGRRQPQDEKYLRIINKVSMEDVIPHVFLPRDLPQEEQKNLIQVEESLLDILEYVFAATGLQDTDEEGISCMRDICPKTYKLLQRWVIAQKILSSPTALSYNNLIPRDIEDGEMVAFYIRSQNCGLFLSAPQSPTLSGNQNKLIISSFKASQGSSEVVSCIGDRAVLVPQQSIWISKTELLHSTEFARQLCILNRTQVDSMMPEIFKAGKSFPSIRNVAYPHLITDLVSLALSDGDSEVAQPQAAFPQIQKTVRDDVRWGNCLLPFRRSGLWFTAKAALQISLIREHGETSGVALYKAFMIQVLSFVLKCHHNASPTEKDTLMEMMPNITRRVEKLKKLVKAVGEMKSDVSNFMNFIIDATVRNIKPIHAVVTEEWNKFSLSQLPDVEKVILPRHRLLLDLKHQLDALTKELNQRRSMELPSDISGKAIPKPACPFRINSSSVIIPSIPTTSGYILDFELRQVEEWILLNIDGFVEVSKTEGGTSKAIRTLIKNYFHQAQAHYKGDPIAIGRMVTTILKCIKVLDQIAVREYPILKQHKAGVDINMFAVLLAPLREDMEGIHELESYFLDRDNMSQFDSFIEESSPNEFSVSVRFAKQFQEMVNLREKILEEAKVDIKMKKEEIVRVRSECEELRGRISLLSCEYTWNSYYERREHSSSCSKCSLKDQLESKRTSVRRYERPLPKNEDQQYSIMFNLLVPSSVACLRDMLFFLRNTVCGESDLKPVENIQRNWKDYDSSRVGKFSLMHNEMVCLVSNVKPSLDAHTGRNNPDVFSSESEFILNNGMNTLVQADLKVGHSIKQQSTFQISAKNAAYASMQWSLDYTSHTTNEVLSKQNSCHKDMSLAEFYKFGSLRSGHRLQYRNIFSSLITKKLSLKSEAVFQLICQAMMECEKQDFANPQVLREAHVDMSNPEFVLEALILLEKMVAENSENWSEPFIQLNIIAVISRICELANDKSIKEKTVEVLKKCRPVCCSWIKTIKEIIGESHDIPEDNKKELNFKLIDASIALAMTFFVGKGNLELVMQNSEDVMYWLTAMTTLYDEVFRDFKSIEPQLSQTRRTLLRCIVSTALFAEKSIIALIDADFGILKKLTKARWPVCEVFYGNWNRLRGPYKQVYECEQVVSREDTNHTVHIDVLLGKFLVDGSPVGKLPEEIVQHDVYQLVFRGVDFQAQRDCRGVYTTVLEYSGCFYTFYLPECGNLIIKEINTADDGSNKTLELIPHDFFQKELPVHFINNFSHWWERETMQIHLRKNSFQDPKFHAQPEYTLHLNKACNECVEKMLVENLSGRKLVYMNSLSCKLLTEVLRRLDSVDYMHLWVHESKRPVDIELVRFNLKLLFEDGEFHSHEYPGYKLSKNQNVGTLVGLQSLIVLEGPQISHVVHPAKIVIVPHGEITTLGDTYHRKTYIRNSSRSPPFLSFEVDEILKTLKAGRNQSAWFFLAALHGITSSALPDPFTGLTGTEMALHILQSARSYSCKPYYKESVKTLEFISGMTPTRSYYPGHLKCMETLSWPMNLSPLTSHDGYFFIVQKLIKDSGSQFQSSTKSNEQLNRRHYWRHMLYANDSMKITAFFYPEFLQTNPKTLALETSPVFKAEISNRVISRFYNSIEKADYNLDIEGHPVKHLLVIPASLPGLDLGYLNEFPATSVKTWIEMEIRGNWINLYAVALAVTRKGWENQWNLLLASMAFSQQDCNHLQLLQAIAKNSSLFPPPLNYTEYSEPTATYSESQIKSILQCNSKSFPRSLDSFSTYASYNLARDAYDEEVRDEVEAISRRIKSEWPCASTCIYCSNRIDGSQAKQQINTKLFMWYQNLELNQFINEVNSALRLLHKSNSIPVLSPFTFLSMPLAPAPKFTFNYGEMMTSLIRKNTKACEIFTQGTVSQTCNCVRAHPKSTENKECKETSLLQIRKASKTIWNEFVAVVAPEELVGAQVLSGLYPRMVPIVMFKILLETSGDSRVKCVQDYLGAVAVLKTLEQRYIRCLAYLFKGASMQVPLQRELETMGYENWSAREYPGWVLLQLESNMMIRPIQLKVAKEMMCPRSGKNSVMQLNMGEGKSCLIVPMLAVALADGKQLCRITVLKSIFETNFNSLVHTLGGLLGQRVISVPCQRDSNIEQKVGSILALYKSTTANSVLVTLPEYRLSFQLKGYEMAYQDGKKADAMKMLETQSWLNSHARDILDESDEILSVKYQLVYTMGSQVHVGGGNMRWEIVQKVLKVLPKRILELWDEFGDSCVEIDRTKTEECFPHCRLLKKNCYKSLMNALVEDFLQGRIISSFPQLTTTQRNLIKAFLTGISEANGGKPISPEEHKAAIEIFADRPANLELILILAGYLRYEVLYVALTKRWKVNYGVKKDGHRKMAVPFKAKDVASERTEFGHPDMAIVLTQLSYYYSGLSDDQLQECFDYLSLKQQQLNPAELYDSWLRTIPSEKIHDSVKSYGGLNLDNFKQRTKYLFPMLSKATVVIDFWLSYFVFPRESKQFPGKMTCTAWDLCSENQRLLTTGFSGTNDSSDLLPHPVTQNDLQELQNTNKCLESVLMLQENRGYKSLPPSGQETETETMSEFILKSLKRDKIKVLLDCGALMLELGNEEVAKKWLEIDDEIEGVVFFNSKNSLTVKMRGAGNKDCPLELSPFRERLDTCAVYLDDEHTRGTDLKFPRGSLACVTVGAGMTRDKLVQACMRMRMLGKGHSVTFWVSHEAHCKISALKLTQNTDPTSEDVLDWVKRNSREFVENGLVYWTASAVNYVRKLSAEKMTDFGNLNMELLGKLCVEKEVLKLLDMYGKIRSEDKFMSIISVWFKALRQSLLKVSETEELTPEVANLLENIKMSVLKRCKKLIPEKVHFAQLLDEEQEKELENELEEEKEPDPPREAKPAPYHLHPFVKQCITSGNLSFYAEQPELLPESAMRLLPYSFEHTELASLCDLQHSGWGNKVFATTTFITTIIRQNQSENVDEFLRPPNWVVSLQEDSMNGCVLLLISPEEANELIPLFRNRQVKSTLHMYTPRLLKGQRDTLIDKSNLCLPPMSVWLSHELLSPLSLFSGTLYFNSCAEEEAFSKFLQIIPREGRTAEQTAAFDAGKIAPNGFVKFEHRNELMQSHYSSGFNQNPGNLVNEILRTRNQGTVPDGSHVKKLASDGMASFKK